MEQGPELLPQFGRATLLEGDHEVPVVLLADREGPTTPIQAVKAQTEAQLGEGGFEATGPAIKGLEFAVLFLRLIISRCPARRVFDKLPG